MRRSRWASLPLQSWSQWLSCQEMRERGFLLIRQEKRDRSCCCGFLVHFHSPCFQGKKMAFLPRKTLWNPYCNQLWAFRTPCAACSAAGAWAVWDQRMQGRGSVNPRSVDTIVEKGSLLAWGAGTPGAQKGDFLVYRQCLGVEGWLGCLHFIPGGLGGGLFVCLFCGFLFSCWVFLFLFFVLFFISLNLLGIFQSSFQGQLLT